MRHQRPAEGTDMAKEDKNQEVQKYDPNLLGEFAQESEERAAEQQTGTFPPHIKIVSKQKGKQQTSRVRVIFPEQRDEKGNTAFKEAEHVRGVLLNHLPYRELRYRDGDGNWVSESFAVGVKKEAWCVGSFHGGPVPYPEVERNWQHYDKQRTVTTIEGNVETTDLRWTSKVACIFLLDRDFWVSEDEPLLAMAFISNSSFYGTSIEDAEDSELRNFTLRAFPVKGQGEDKGILLRLNSRPWEFGEEQGVANADKTPTSAIWLNLFGAWLGTITAVHAFDIAEECDYEELALIKSVKPQARDVFTGWMATQYRYADERLTQEQANQLASYAYDKQFGQLAEQARKALPAQITPEVEPEEGEGSDDAEDVFTKPGRPSFKRPGTSKPVTDFVSGDEAEFDEFDE